MYSGYAVGSPASGSVKENRSTIAGSYSDNDFKSMNIAAVVIIVSLFLLLVAE
jgi:hypothetical protein